MSNINNLNENNEKSETSETSDYSMKINENKNLLRNFFNNIKNRLSQKRLSSGNIEKHVTNASISSMWNLAQLRASITGTISKGINSVIERFSKQEETKNGFQTEIIGEHTNTQIKDKDKKKQFSDIIMPKPTSTPTIQAEQINTTALTQNSAKQINTTALTKDTHPDDKKTSGYYR